MLTGGVILVQASGRGLVEERMNAIREQADIIGGTLAAYATDPETHTLKVADAEPLLGQLIAPRGCAGGFICRAASLPSIPAIFCPAMWCRSANCHRWTPTANSRNGSGVLYDGVMGVRPFAQLEPYYEAGDDGRVVSRSRHRAERRHRHGRTAWMIATGWCYRWQPVESRYRTIYGVLLLSTEGGDIDDILRAERFTLFEVFLVAFLVMLFTSSIWRAPSPSR